MSLRLLLPLLLLTVTLPAEAGLKDLFRRDSGPELYAVQCGRFVALSDHELPAGFAAAAACELDALHLRLETELKLNVSKTESLRMYLFADQKAFSAYVREHIPYLTRQDTHRNALFLLRNGTPYLFAIRNADLLTSLRHEYTHVYLNTAIPGLPIWLDEGLAQYYETGHAAGANPRALALLQQAGNRWSPDLPRLEKIATMPQMGRLEYAESWAWVTMTRAAAPALIPDYLAQLKTAGNTRPALHPALQQQWPNPAARLQNWVSTAERLAGGR